MAIAWPTITLLEEKEQARLQERIREYTIALRRKMLLRAAGLMALGIIWPANSGVFPESVHRYVVYLGFVAMAAAAIVTHFLPR